jgi:hypothetical protein
VLSSAGGEESQCQARGDELGRRHELIHHSSPGERAAPERAVEDVGTTQNGRELVVEVDNLARRFESGRP